MVDQAPTPDGVFPVRERRLLADEWADFYAQVWGPVGVRKDSDAYHALRQSFMGGASALMALFSTDTDPQTELTKLDEDYIEALQNELRQYVRDLEAGKA